MSSAFVITCPWCEAEKATFRVFGARPCIEQRFASSGYNAVSIAAVCEICDMPIIIAADEVRTGASYASFKERVSKIMHSDVPLDELNIEYSRWYPRGPQAQIPSSLPAPIERSLRQAERNFAAKDCEDAAAIMYRRALESAIKDKFPDAKGTLAARIDKAVTLGGLPQFMSDWAHEVRLVGNDGAHDLEGVSRVDLEAARGFVDAFLRYLYSLPAMVEERRAKRELFKD